MSSHKPTFEELVADLAVYCIDLASCSMEDDEREVRDQIEEARAALLAAHAEVVRERDEARGNYELAREVALKSKDQAESNAEQRRALEVKLELAQPDAARLREALARLEAKIGDTGGFERAIGDAIREGRSIVAALQAWLRGE